MARQFSSGLSKHIRMLRAPSYSSCLRERILFLMLVLMCGTCAVDVRASEGGEYLIELAKFGVEPDPFLEKINESRLVFDLSVAEICRLRSLSVPPRVIAAAVNQARRRHGEPEQSGKAPPSPGYEQLIKLIRAGVDDDALVGLLSSSTIPYDLTVDEILYLNELGGSVRAIDSAVRAGKAQRSGVGKEVDDLLDQLRLRPLLDTEPETHFILKAKNGAEFSLNKWMRDTVSVFVLTENRKPVRTVVSTAFTLVPAEYKTEEYKVEAARGTPGGPETRLRQICIAPERVTYSLKDKIVLSHSLFYDGVEKGVYLFKRGKATIGAEEFDVVDVRITQR